jgi:two-component system, OmpR family, sensor kinase
MTLRTRLTLFYSAIVLGILLVLCGVLLWNEPRVGLTFVDADLRSDAITVEGVLLHEAAEGHDRQEAVHEMLSELGLSARGLAVFDRDGTRLGERWEGLEPSDPALLRPSADPDPRTVMTPSGPGRLYQRLLGPAGEWRVAIVTSLAPVARDSAILERSLLVAVPVAVLVAALGGWFILTRSLRPVELMAREASAITASDPGRRLSVVESPDDLGRLASTFNDLLDRLSDALRRQREFMADASHELRTPASVVRTAAEVTLSAPLRSEAEYRDALEIVRDQTRRMARLIDDMLLIARADMGQKPVAAAPFYLDEIVAETVRSLRVLAQPRAVSIAADCPSGLQLQGDEGLIRQMLVNLLDNAVRYSRPGGTVRLDAAVHGVQVIVDVADEGPGVPIADRVRIFERFIKLDASRAHQGGAGLGLPIARWIAEAHGGSLELQESGASGSRFRMALPL